MFIAAIRSFPDHDPNNDSDDAEKQKTDRSSQEADHEAMILTLLLRITPISPGIIILFIIVFIAASLLGDRPSWIIIIPVIFALRTRFLSSSVLSLSISSFPSLLIEFA